MAEVILLIIGFLILSGTLAMIDAAILSVSAGEVEELMMEKKWGSVALKRITRHTTRAIIVVVIVTNIINIGGPILIGQKTEQLLGSQLIGIITALLAFLSIIVAEVIPKAIGAHYAPTIARYVAPCILTLEYVLSPLVYVLEKLTRLFRHGRRKIGTEEQIRALVDIGGSAGHIEEAEGKMIKRAFGLNDLKARDVMTPWQQVVSIPHSASIGYAARVVFHNTFSRYPVLGKSQDDVRGLALSRDILEALADGKDHAKIEMIMLKILIVQHDMALDDVLALLRRRKSHIAVVKDHEKTIGLLTMEDVLEELVGEIEDEGDA